MSKTRGRPLEYKETTEVRLCASGESKLQENSDRRAIVNLLVDNGGIMTMGAINDHFGFDISPKVIALIRAGWLRKV